jgi:hypothetical protein
MRARQRSTGRKRAARTPAPSLPKRWQTFKACIRSRGLRGRRHLGTGQLARLTHAKPAHDSRPCAGRFPRAAECRRFEAGRRHAYGLPAPGLDRLRRRRRPRFAGRHGLKLPIFEAAEIFFFPLFPPQFSVPGRGRKSSRGLDFSHSGTPDFCQLGLALTA